MKCFIFGHQWQVDMRKYQIGDTFPRARCARCGASAITRTLNVGCDGTVLGVTAIWPESIRKPEPKP